MGKPDDNLWSLTEKEKQTLRLMVRGHDAKSIARSLDLSVHTINERLRDARRKMAVASSREAARLLLAAEEESATAAPKKVGDVQLRADAAAAAHDVEAAPPAGAPQAVRRLRFLTGVLAMTLLLGVLALAIAPQLAPEAGPPAGAEQPVDPQVVDSARAFLVLLDHSRWNDSYRITASAFQRLNSAETWARVSQDVRAPLGAAVSRTLLSQENLPAPPDGYEVVKFRTRFANRAQAATETVSLVRENGAWRVAGVTVG